MNRDVYRWKRPVFWHKSFSNFKQSKALKSGIHSFQHAGLFFDFLIEDNQSNVTVIFFHPAMDRKDKQLPFFVGNKVLNGQTINKVQVSDPSLLMSPNIRLAWYAGISRGVKVQDVILESFKTIFTKLISGKLIFMGASNGGYAALYFSFFFKESIAYVINPQTRIADFTKAAVEEFALACLGAKNINDVSSALGNTESDVRRLYSSGFDNFIIYVQNETDHHVQTQMNPFLACLQKDIVVIRGNWGVGHTAPPVSYMSELLKKLIHMSIIDLKNKGSSLLSVGQDMEVGSSEVKHGDEVIG